MKRTINMGDNEPDQKAFAKPSEGEHLFQVVDIFDQTNAPGKMVLDENTVCVKCEVAIGDELGRTLLQRLTLLDTAKTFFLTRLFLKAIGLQHKGQVTIDTEEWIGKQFFATVIHTSGKNGGTFANIKEYNFDKVVDKGASLGSPADIAWEE